MARVTKGVVIGRATVEDTLPEASEVEAVEEVVEETVPEVEAALDVELEVNVSEAEIILPVSSGPMLLRATQFRLYNPYQKLYFGTAAPVLAPELDSWNKCQVDAGLLEVVVEGEAELSEAA